MKLCRKTLPMHIGQQLHGYMFQVIGYSLLITWYLRVAEIRVIGPTATSVRARSAHDRSQVTGYVDYHHTASRRRLRVSADHGQQERSDHPTTAVTAGPPSTTRSRPRHLTPTLRGTVTIRSCPGATAPPPQPSQPVSADALGLLLSADYTRRSRPPDALPTQVLGSSSTACGVQIKAPDFAAP
ncbi:hypothetical protein NDU88_001053 [Pleurodeles waltl]|uniref:Uncharacterized protein n=1 Tax=Pleurodeles waltl TaxID=8319 RepID=A0AAV7VVA7_PLEWA|nr:hypothetical protein NDU88_001053 [Pleurodeles waltl]